MKKERNSRWIFSSRRTLFFLYLLSILKLDENARAGVYPAI